MSTRTFNACLSALMCLFALVLLAGQLAAQTDDMYVEAQMAGIGVNERLDAQVPLEMEFINSEGKKIQLKELFKEGRPVLLTFNYYDCPMLCNLQLTNLSKAYKAIKKDLQIGKDFLPVSISMSPKDTVESAAKGESRYGAEAEAEAKGVGNAWTFLISPDNKVKELADRVGFLYKEHERVVEGSDEVIMDYGHQATLIFLTPAGRIAQYYYKASYEDLPLENSAAQPATDSAEETFVGLIGAIQSAAAGVIIDPEDQAKLKDAGLNCLLYNTTDNGRRALGWMKIGAIITLVMLASFLGVLWVKYSGDGGKSDPGAGQVDPAKVD